MQRRQDLVNDVLEQGKSVIRVAKRLNIKLSTAKLILKNYKITGQLLQKNMKRCKKFRTEQPAAREEAKTN